MSTENWMKVVESAPNSDVWTDTYRTGPSEVEYMHPCLPCAARIEWEAK